MRMHMAALAAATALAAGTALAQSRPKPDDPKAAAPPIAHRSAYEGYRPYSEGPMASWREVNDEVARVDGHSGVLRAEEAARKDSATGGAPPLPAKAPPAQGHKH